MNNDTLIYNVEAIEQLADTTERHLNEFNEAVDRMFHVIDVQMNQPDHWSGEVYEDFKSKNIGTYYYLTRYGTKPHTSFDYSNKDENIYLIFGKESTGIPKDILKNDLEHCMRIPMTNKVRALNISNSVAIMVYEVLRQQDYRDLLRCEPHKGEDYLQK